MAYTTRAAVLAAAGKTNDPTSADLNALIDEVMPQAAAMIDLETGGTWFDSREKRLLLLPVSGALNLTMPAPIIDLESVTDRATVLTARQYVNGGTFLHYPSGWSSDLYDDETVLRYPVEVIGTFGYETTPEDVARIAAELTAVLCGIKKRTYINRERMQEAVTLTSIPDWIKSALAHRIKFDHSDQEIVIEDVE